MYMYMYRGSVEYTCNSLLMIQQISHCAQVSLARDHQLGVNTVLFFCRVGGGGIIVCSSVPNLGGSGGMLPHENFFNLWPLRLLLVASETTYTDDNLLYINLSHSTIGICTIFKGGGTPGAPPLYINKSTGHVIQSMQLNQVYMYNTGRLSKYTTPIRYYW